MRSTQQSYASQPTVPCGICGLSTTVLRTRRCDRCWELESRIENDPRLACEILARLMTGER